MADRRDESAGGEHAQRKKQCRGGAPQQHQRRQEPHARGGKRYQQAGQQQQAAGPSAAFLAALEEQRENERRRQELQQLQQRNAVMETAHQADAIDLIAQRCQRQAQRPAPITMSAVSAPQSAPTPVSAQRKPAHITGFYYDEAQNRYFKLTPQMKQQIKQSKQQRIAREKDAARGKALQASRERHYQHHSAEAGALRSALRARLNAASLGWVGYFAQRESTVMWRSGRRGQREMMPRLFASTMPQQELRPLHVGVFESRHRITSLDLQAKGGYGAMGFTGGRLDVLRIDHESDLRSGFVRQGERRITNVQQMSAGASFQISAVKWRPTDEVVSDGASDLLYACVGGEPSAKSTGFVSLLRRCGSHVTTTSSKWPFNDPWSIEWSLGRAGNFAAGLSGPNCAAYVDIEARDGVTRAPAGKIKSDVMAQAFSSDGNTILNGTRNGSTWLWDLRASRRAHEHTTVATKASFQTASGAILDLRVLSGDFQVLVLKSNGELHLVDTRGAQRNRKSGSNVVVEYAAGGSNTYLPMLKCAVDDTETVVVATGNDSCGDGMTGCGASSTVCSYQISTGALLSQIIVNRSQMSKAPAPLEQVHLRRSLSRDTMPEVFALSRNELFASADKREALDKRDQ